MTPRPGPARDHVARVAALSVLPAAWLCGQTAHAAPDDGYPLSNDAAMRGGAAIVLGRDATSLWYNPAAIAATQRIKFDATITAYGIRLLRVPSSFQAEVDGETRREPGHDTQVLVVPSGTAFAFGFPKHKLAGAVSFHVPQQNDSRTRLELEGRSERGGYDYTQAVTMDSRVQQYHFGLTLAWQPVERFRIGTTIGGIYDSRSSFVRFVADAQDESTGAVGTLLGDLDSANKAFALEAALGLQGELTRWLHAGAMVRLPAKVMWNGGEGAQAVSAVLVNDMGDFGSATEEMEVVGNPPRWLTPWTVGAGLALRLKRFDLEVDASASNAVRGTDPAYRRRGVFNVQLGGTFAITPKLAAGLGTFTDRTTRPGGELYPDVVIDRWGGTGGLRISSPVKLANSERTEELVFETTLAARYAFGFGQSNALGVVYPDGGPDMISLEVSDEVRAQEHVLTFHVGSGLRF